MIDLINEEDKHVWDEEDPKRVRGDEEESLSVLPPTKKIKQQASLDPAPNSTAFTPYHLNDMSIKQSWYI